jgi:hypothetical protein
LDEDDNEDDDAVEDEPMDKEEEAKVNMEASVEE